MKENLVLEIREVGIENDFVLEYEFNVGCGQMFNKFNLLVYLEYFIDNGVMWFYFLFQCFLKDFECNGGLYMGSVYYSELMGMWRRFFYILFGLLVLKLVF